MVPIVQVYRPSEDGTGSQRAAFTRIMDHLQGAQPAGLPLSPLATAAAANIVAAIATLEHRNVSGEQLDFTFRLLWATADPVRVQVESAQSEDVPGPEHLEITLHSAGALPLTCQSCRVPALSRDLSSVPRLARLANVLPFGQQGLCTSSVHTQYRLSLETRPPFAYNKAAIT